MSANDAFGEVPPSAAAHASMDPDRFRRTEIMVMVLLMMMIDDDGDGVVLLVVVVVGQ